MAGKDKVTVELSTQDRNLLKDIRDALLALNADNDEAQKVNADEGASRRLVEILPRTVTLFVDDEQVSQAVVNEYAIKERKRALYCGNGPSDEELFASLVHPDPVLMESHFEMQTQGKVWNGTGWVPKRQPLGSRRGDELPEV